MKCCSRCRRRLFLVSLCFRFRCKLDGFWLLVVVFCEFWFDPLRVKGEAVG
jgi:hypothetical protein